MPISIFPIYNEKFYAKYCVRGDYTTAERIEICNCDKCGNEAEMTISCRMIDVETPSGAKLSKEIETWTCKVCGNEADMIIDFSD